MTVFSFFPIISSPLAISFIPSIPTATSAPVHISPVPVSAPASAPDRILPITTRAPWASTSRRPNWRTTLLAPPSSTISTAATALTGTMVTISSVYTAPTRRLAVLSILRVSVRGAASLAMMVSVWNSWWPVSTFMSSCRGRHNKSANRSQSSTAKMKPLIQTRCSLDTKENKPFHRLPDVFSQNKPLGDVEHCLPRERSRNLAMLKMDKIDNVQYLLNLKKFTFKTQTRTPLEINCTTAELKLELTTSLYHSSQTLIYPNLCHSFNDPSFLNSRVISVP